MKDYIGRGLVTAVATGRPVGTHSGCTAGLAVRLNSRNASDTVCPRQAVESLWRRSAACRLACPKP